MYYSTWYGVMKRLGERMSIISFLLCDIGWMLYNFALAPYITWKNKKQWT
jgi:hypothetical protein